MPPWKEIFGQRFGSDNTTEKSCAKRCGLSFQVKLLSFNASQNSIFRSLERNYFEQRKKAVYTLEIEVSKLWKECWSFGLKMHLLKKFS